MKEIKLNEYVSLLKIRVFYSGGAYTLNVESGAKKAPDHFVFRGDHDSFVRFLMGIKAKDNKTWPRSVRGERYTDIANEIENGSDPIIYVWEHDFMRYINKKKQEEEMRIVKTPRFQEDSIYALIISRITEALKVEPEVDRRYTYKWSFSDGSLEVDANYGNISIRKKGDLVIIPPKSFETITFMNKRAIIIRTREIEIYFDMGNIVSK